MNILKPPSTTYKDYYDQARYSLVWYISLVFTGFILVLTAVNFSSENYQPYSYLMGFLMSFGSLIILRILRKYELVSYIISIGGFGITTYTFLGLSDVIQYTTPMWVVINILFTYFTLGRR